MDHPEMLAALVPMESLDHKAHLGHPAPLVPMATTVLLVLLVPPVPCPQVAREPPVLLVNQEGVEPLETPAKLVLPATMELPDPAVQPETLVLQVR